MVVKPFVDNYDYKPSDTLTADETYIKVRGVKGYIWFIMDAFSRSIIGYRVSDNRSVGPCILAMRQALKYFKKLPKTFGSLLTATVPILWLPRNLSGNWVMILLLTSLRSSVLQTMMRFPKNSVLSNR